jgi:hypothetical protein
LQFERVPGATEERVQQPSSNLSKNGNNKKEIRDKSDTARGEAISPEELRKTDKIEGSSLCVSQDDYMLLPPPHPIS